MNLMLWVALLGCGDAPAPAPSTAPTAAVAPGQRRDVDVATLHATQGARVLDVRTTGEVLGGKVPGATNIPIDELESRLAELGPPTDQEIYVICKSGGRSAAASEVLVKHGYKVANVKGGMIAWQDAGYETD